MMQAPLPPAPPPVIVSPNEAQAIFATFPRLKHGDAKFIILQATVAGDGAVLEQAKAKLASENWPSEYQQAPDGSTVLRIGFERRTLKDATSIMRRLQAGEFGKIAVHPLALPDLSSR